MNNKSAYCDIHEFFSTQEISAALAVPEETVVEIIESGELPGFRVGDGGPLRVVRAQFDSWLDARGEIERRLVALRGGRYAGLADIGGARSSHLRLVTS